MDRYFSFSYTSFSDLFLVKHIKNCYKQIIWNVRFQFQILTLETFGKSNRYDDDKFVFLRQVISTFVMLLRFNDKKTTSK